MNRARPAPSIPTPASTKLTRQRLDRRLQEVSRVLDASHDGAALRLHYQQGRPIWSLSTGPFVTPEVAAIVTTKPDVIAVDNGLPFPGSAPMTWRISDE